MAKTCNVSMNNQGCSSTSTRAICEHCGLPVCTVDSRKTLASEFPSGTPAYVRDALVGKRVCNDCRVQYELPLVGPDYQQEAGR